MWACGPGSRPCRSSPGAGRLRGALPNLCRLVHRGIGRAGGTSAPTNLEADGRCRAPVTGGTGAVGLGRGGGTRCQQAGYRPPGDQLSTRASEPKRGSRCRVGDERSRDVDPPDDPRGVNSQHAMSGTLCGGPSRKVPPLCQGPPPTRHKQRPKHARVDTGSHTAPWTLRHRKSNPLSDERGVTSTNTPAALGRTTHAKKKRAEPDSCGQPRRCHPS